MKKIPKAEATIIDDANGKPKKKIKQKQINPKAIRKIYTKMFLIFRRN